MVVVPGRQQRHRLHQTKKPTRDNGEVDEHVARLETILKEVLVVVHDKPMKINFVLMTIMKDLAMEIMVKV